MPLRNIDLYLKPKFLDTNIKDHLLSEVRKKSKQICGPKLGYITDVKRIVKSVNTEDSLFKLLCDVEYYKPKVGDEFWGTILRVMDDVFLTETKFGQKVAVLNSFKYDVGSVGWMLLIKLINVQYHRHSFRCMGMVV